MHNLSKVWWSLVAFHCTSFSYVMRFRGKNQVFSNRFDFCAKSIRAGSAYIHFCASFEISFVLPYFEGALAQRVEATNWSTHGKVVLHTKCPFCNVILWYSESHCPILKGWYIDWSSGGEGKAKRTVTGEIIGCGTMPFWQWWTPLKRGHCPSSHSVPVLVCALKA